jgi:hypothetical protein
VKTRVKNSPLHIAAARELRDRWLEQVNRDPSHLLSNGKYYVTRSLPEISAPLIDIKALPAAA